ncbi:MAG: hypothetical protein JXR65_11675 [Bacteroidales bacterium]|nr:hypothetical protein [Bacteroidales bacterium]
MILKESDTKPFFIECNLISATGQPRFGISKAYFIEKILNRFNKQKIKSANKKLNSKYLVSRDESQKIREIINDTNITNIMLREHPAFIGGEHKKNGSYKLSLNIHRNINNIEQLESIYNLTIALIDTLKRKN